MSVAITGAAVSRERPQRGRLADRERPLKWSSMRRPRSIDRLRLLEAEQALPHHEQIRQRAGDHEPMPILDQAAAARGCHGCWRAYEIAWKEQNDVLKFGDVRVIGRIVQSDE